MLTNMPAEVQESLGKQVLFPVRLGTPDEYARLAIHMVENAYINGETIRLDGAMRMAARQGACALADLRLRPVPMALAGV